MPLAIVFVKVALIRRTETKALIGGVHIRVLPNEFLLKSTVMTTEFKRNSSGRTRIYEYTPPPPINALVSALLIRVISWNLTPLPIVLSDSKIDNKKVPFSVLSLQEPINKKGTLFHLLQTNVIAR